MTLLDRIREVLKRDNVSFAELSRIEGFSGHLEWIMYPSNIVLWGGMSRAAFEALQVIRDEDEYEIVPTTALTYLLEGKQLTYPVAEQVRDYPEPHWCPVVFQRRRTH
jgi:hypothetical protein